jgi:hypothetical protein
VEAIEHMQSLRNLLGDDVQGGPPHVAGNEPNPFPNIVSQQLKEPSQALLGAVLRYPKKPLDAADLVDERQVLLAASPLNLVHPNGLDPRQVAMDKTPRNCMFYRAKHAVPARVEGVGRLLP